MDETVWKGKESENIDGDDVNKAVGVKDKHRPSLKNKNIQVCIHNT
jgi:hypothetical protein